MRQRSAREAPRENLTEQRGATKALRYLLYDLCRLFGTFTPFTFQSARKPCEPRVRPASAGGSSPSSVLRVARWPLPVSCVDCGVRCVGEGVGQPITLFTDCGRGCNLEAWAATSKHVAAARQVLRLLSAYFAVLTPECLQTCRCLGATRWAIKCSGRG